MESMFGDEDSPVMAMYRFLQEETKKKAAYDTIDYTILSVAVATLGLILVVEILRHKIDHMAHGRPFFLTVLHSVNSELATLGIVEFVVFLIQKYYAGLDKAQKEVFADVHFMLFYCALFNALQSVLLAFFSYRVADRLWVKTETLELNHYIEIREEFERVDSILYGDEQSQRRVPASEFVFEYNLQSLRKSWDRFCRFVRHPIMSQRHADLLVQVRFHDLRVHFLKANGLPLQLLVSDYLKRSLLSVLQKLAHISAVAWLLLTGAIALVYFLMGIVIYVTNDLTKVGVSLTWIYLCSMIFFVVLSLIIYNKMKWVFDRIMRMKLLGTSNLFKSGMSIRKGEKHVQNQSDLFWGSNPNIITVIIQFAQFGFALALSILLVFWDDINVKNVPVASWVYIVTVFACYAAFVAIIAQVIPRFTLCTNLGQLLNKKHLQETLGEFYLQEAERKRQEELEDDDYIEMNNADDASALSKDSPNSATFNPIESSTRTTTSNSSTENQGKRAMLADLVQSDTETLRSLVNGGDESLRSTNERSMRRKAVSDGVAMMRSMSGRPPKPPGQQRSKVERKKSNSSSDVVFEMQNEEVTKPIHKSNSGPSLNTLSQPFEPIDEHKVAPVAPPPASHRRSRTLSSGTPPLPPLDETSTEVVEVAISVDPLVGSMATLSHPQEPSAADDKSTDDIPLDDETHHYHVDQEPTYLIDAMKDYFSGPKYPVVSAVFGTLGCFWVVGQRIEELLLATGALPDLKNTFQFPLNVSFWWETAYLACFILASSFVVLAFGCGRATSNRERTLSLAGFLDVALASTCLILLMVAEVQRCYCIEGDSQEDCCPKFGNRTYGGVGNIEPITSIIAFRLFRFWVAKKIIRFLDRYTQWSSKDVVSAKKDHHGHGHHGHGDDPREMAVDVWKAALALYPETVEEHGEFSTELLQKMLGVDASVNKPVKIEPKMVQEDEISTVDAFVSAEEHSPSKVGGSYVPKRVRHKQAMDSANTSLNVKESPTPTNLSNVSATFGQKITFVRPNAKILRSMRRCDRKLLPLINTWTAVDIVMSKYEIVYFEALDIEDPCKARYNDLDLQALEAGRQALNVTSGGKGVRLKDIAKGRKVVGHLAISEIDNVHVDRILPHKDKKHEESECYFEKHDEFWELDKETYIQKDGLSREARWARVKEDRLMIHSNHGTLCFRFYSDLSDMEDHLDRTLTESERAGTIHKDLALLWCQSIGRVCKRAQLKQKLEHYGESNDEELRDYLRVVDAKDHGNDRMMDKIHRRASSAVGMLPRLRRSNSVPSDMDASSPVASKRPPLGRGKTVGGQVNATVRDHDGTPDDGTPNVTTAAEVDEFLA